MIRRASLALALSTALVAASGCRDSGLTTAEETSTEHLALREIGEGYRLFTIAYNKPPAKLADLAKVEGVGGNGVAAAGKGEIVVRMGAKLPDTGEEPGKTPSTEVLAYEKKAEQGEGYVLLLDRSIRKMTAAELKSATMAGVEAPAEPTKAARK